MSLKKLSLAAAVSIGVITLSGIALAGPCSVCPQQVVPTEPCCPCQQAVCPTCNCNPCTCNPCSCDPCNPCGCAAPSKVIQCEPVSACVPNCHPNALTLKRQAFAFPTIGSSSVVIPKGKGLLQIGGEEEALASSNCCSSLSLYPEGGQALTLYPKGAPMGGACGIAPVCPTEIMQGTEIGRCSIPNSTSILQSAAYFGNDPCSPCSTGGALAIPVQQGNLCDPCNPCSTGYAVPVDPCCDPCCQSYVQCDPCNPCSTGCAVPISPCSPCQSCDPCCQPCNPCSTGCAVPISPCSPCQSCNPCCDPCSTGAAAQMAGCAIPIQTSSGIEVQRTVLVPVEVPCEPTGCACPVDPQFPDVSNSMYSGCDINKLASEGILAGYPDRTYKPNLPIMRDEFASAMVSALELENVPDFDQQIFKDVPLGHWANADIDKAYNRGIMSGYPDDSFKPDGEVTREEALTAMAKVIPGDISTCEAQNILKSFPDANELSGWAAIPVAEAVCAGLTKDLPNNTHLRPNESASRAEIASMLKQLRIKLCLDPCEVKPIGAATQLQPQVMSHTIPTLKVKMQDIVTARTSLVGDGFGAKTLEPVTINGQCFPEGSKVTGKVVEVVRPGFGEKGAIRLSFDRIEYKKCKADLPNEILSATVIKEDNPNIVGRFVAWPITWTGKVAGIAGRTVGGGAIVAADMVEGFLNNIGNGTNEIFNGEFLAAGRSFLSSGREVGVGVYDFAKTAFTGTAGVLKESGDEIAYVVSPDGARIAQVNPDETLSVAFNSK